MKGELSKVLKGTKNGTLLENRRYFLNESCKTAVS